MKSRPLEGLTVLDFSWNLPGPYTTLVLQSMGAEVWKIEPPRGDPARHVGRLFDLLNRGKRSIVLDLGQDEGRQHLEALVRKADVLVEGFRPGVLARLGCSAADALEWNPRLVYCSISAFGQQGPAAGFPGHDLNLQAMTGLCQMERDLLGRPTPMVLPVADLSAAMTAASQICAALVARERTGEGCVVDIAMADTLKHWTRTWSAGVDLVDDLRRQGAAGAVAAASPWFARLRRRRLYALPHYQVVRCLDGRFLAVGIVDEQHFWRRLCEALGLPGVGGLSLRTRVALGPVLRRMVRWRMLMRTSVHWTGVLQQADVPVTEVLSPEQAEQHPWLSERSVFSVAGTAPALGQDTDAILGTL